MDAITLEILEYHQVLKGLASFCVTLPGREQALSIRPLEDMGGAGAAYREYAELVRVIKERGRFPLAGVTDIRPCLSRLGPTNAYLLPEEFLSISACLTASESIRQLRNEQFSKLYPLLSSLIGVISDESALVREICRVFDEKGELRDSASPELLRIRKEVRSIKARAKELVDFFLNDKRTREILQEEIVTIREDRYVLLVTAGRQAEFPGIVHGRSNTGATYFIEPLKLVEVNNKLAILRKEEKEEEIAVLRGLSESVLSRRDALNAILEALVKLDCLQAKTLFAEAYAAHVPKLKEAGDVRFFSARHPVLAMNEASGGQKAVPVDILTGERKKALVISGANTGGKTVALKSLGLLSLLASSGIPVTASEDSEAVFFSTVFADIGDRQDITASLSTFSGHIKRIGSFLDAAGHGSLVLIDEIGIGTDPQEGAAFALAAMETFVKAGALIAVTTHLNLLKAHAETNPEYLNVAVEFDEESLKPRYRLCYGSPGPSLGLSIASSLGMPLALIEKARSYISEKEGAFMESIKRLGEEREKVERIKERALFIEVKREEAIRRLKEERAKILDKALKKVDDIVNDARAEAAKIIEGLKEAERPAHKSVARAAAALDVTGERAKERIAGKSAAYAPKPPKSGDRAAIRGSNAKGVVLAVDEALKKAELMVAGKKVVLDWAMLKAAQADKGSGVREGREAVVDADIQEASLINLIGMRAEEALNGLKRFLDNAHAAGMERVEIIHGKGTGALAKAVQGYLSECGLVKRFYHGSESEGGKGKTIVELV